MVVILHNSDSRKKKSKTKILTDEVSTMSGSNLLHFCEWLHCAPYKIIFGKHDLWPSRIPTAFGCSPKSLLSWTSVHISHSQWQKSADWVTVTSQFHPHSFLLHSGDHFLYPLTFLSLQDFWAHCNSWLFVRFSNWLISAVKTSGDAMNSFSLVINLFPVAAEHVTPVFKNSCRSNWTNKMLLRMIMSEWTLNTRVTLVLSVKKEYLLLSEHAIV